MRVKVEIDGPIGCGKTVLANKIADLVRENGVPCELLIKTKNPTDDRWTVEARENV